MCSRNPASSFRQIAICALACLVGGCVYYPLTISPEPLRRGEWSGGGYLTGTFKAREPWGVPAGVAFLRHGLGSGVDIGLNYGLVSPVSVDVRWAVLQKPVFLTTDVGLSYSGWSNGGFDMPPYENYRVLGVNPALLVGSRRFYTGAHVCVCRVFYYGYNHPRSYWDYSPGLMVGASFGRHLRLMPSLEVARVEGHLLFTVGFGLERRFGPGFGDYPER